MKRKLEIKVSLGKLFSRKVGHVLAGEAPPQEKSAKSAVGKAPVLVCMQPDKQPGRPMPIQAVLEDYRKTGKAELASRIFNEYWHLVLGCARRVLDVESEAEDAAMDVFVKVLDRLRLETPQNFGGWLHTVTRHHCYEVRRKWKKAPVLEPIDALQRFAAAGDDYVGWELQQSVVASALHGALAKLPAHQRTCLELFYFHERSYREISDSQGFALAEVKSYIQNGKRRLMGMLEGFRNRHVSDSYA